MDEPIRIIFVLVVAVLTGMALLTFSKDLLTSSKKSLDAFRQDETLQIITPDSLTGREAAYLAEDCLQRNLGENLERVCYAVISGSTLNTAQVISELGTLGYPGFHVEGAGKAVYIAYYPPENVSVILN